MKRFLLTAVVTLIFVSCGAAFAIDMKGIMEDVDHGDKDFPPAMAAFTFKVKGSDLCGIVYLAEGKGPHPTALILHGFPGNEKNLDLAQALRRGGINSVFFGFRGVWGSKGNFSYHNAIEDAVAAVKFFQMSENAEKFRTDPSKIIVMGHSMGGFVTMNVANQLDDIKHFVFIAGQNVGVSAKATAKLEGEAKEKWLKSRASLALPMSGTTPELLFDELVAIQDSHDLINFVPNLKGKKILMVAGTKDTSCPIDSHHRPLYDALKKAYPDDVAECVMDTDHSFSNCRVALNKAIFEWLQSVGF